VELAAAAEAQTFSVLLPNDSITGAITDVCQAEGGGLAITYASEIQLRESTNDLRDAAETWNGIVSRYPGAGYEVLTVRGAPALAAAPSETMLGGLEWVEDGVKIKITGNGQATLNDLRAIADSLAPFTPPSVG
jgi:hypothetical protein